MAYPSGRTGHSWLVHAEAARRRRKAGTCERGSLPLRDPLSDEPLHNRCGPTTLPSKAVRRSSFTSLHQLAPSDREQEFATLLQACRARDGLAEQASTPCFLPFSQRQVAIACQPTSSVSQLVVEHRQYSSNRNSVCPSASARRRFLRRLVL